MILIQMGRLIVLLLVFGVIAVAPAAAQFVQVPPASGSGCAASESKWQKLSNSTDIQALSALRKNLPSTCSYMTAKIDKQIAIANSAMMEMHERDRLAALARSRAEADAAATAVRERERLAALDEQVKLSGLLDHRWYGPFGTDVAVRFDCEPATLNTQQVITYTVASGVLTQWVHYPLSSSYRPGKSAATSLTVEVVAGSSIRVRGLRYIISGNTLFQGLGSDDPLKGSRFFKC